MQEGWTRRYFLQAAGLTVAAHSIGLAHALPLHPAPEFAYVAVQGPGLRSGIQVLRSISGQWESIQFVDSVAPSVVLLGEDLLIVANARTRFEGLPTASVESYRVHPHSRTLTLIERRALGLASVMPHAMALSPDRSLLVVAAAAAGTYNILPISSDGAIGEVTAVRKETRFGTGSSEKMLFVNNNELRVEDALGVRMYRCDRDSISLVQASSAGTPPRTTAMPNAVSRERGVTFIDEA